MEGTGDRVSLFLDEPRTRTIQGSRGKGTRVLEEQGIGCRCVSMSHASGPSRVPGSSIRVFEELGRSDGAGRLLVRSDQGSRQLESSCSWKSTSPSVS
jgi:hypothetical protein